MARNPSETGPLVLLGEIDDLVTRLDGWSLRPVPWGPARRAQFAVRRLVDRLTQVRVRLTAPLVVGTFGGSGSGKSSLVNALVGEEVSVSGRERPTTRRPVLVLSPETDPAELGMPLDEVEVVRSSAPMLREIVLLDLPDPDTSEGSEDAHFAGVAPRHQSTHNSTDNIHTIHNNTARLRRLLPYCDVLLYTSTQQQYRSAKVQEELLRGADGCRLLFVQTRADLDDDIRDDWRSRLPVTVGAEDLFFVDSRRALEQRRSGAPADGEFGRLERILVTQLAATERVRVRWANVGDLTSAALSEIQERLDSAWPPVERVQTVLATQRREAAERMLREIQRELLQSRGLWERRLQSAAIDQWGLTPLTALLRVANGLGGWLASLAMFRARTTAQVALIGVTESWRRLSRARGDARDDERLVMLAAGGLESVDDRAARVVAEGYAREAELEVATASGEGMLPARQDGLAESLLTEARAAIDRLVDQTAATGARIPRYASEAILVLFLAQIVWKPAKNFFYEYPWLDRPLLSSDYYIHAAVFSLLVGGGLVTWVTRSLRAALMRRLPATLTGLSAATTERTGGEASTLQHACEVAREFRAELDRLRDRASELRQRLRGDAGWELPSLGGTGGEGGVFRPERESSRGRGPR